LVKQKSGKKSKLRFFFTLLSLTQFLPICKKFYFTQCNWFKNKFCQIYCFRTSYLF